MKRTVEEWQNRVNELRMIGEWQLWERRIMELRGWITKNGRHIFIGDSGKGGGGVDKSAKSGIIEAGKENNTMEIGMYRKRDSEIITPMPNKQFQRIKKRFKALGGVIQQNEETDVYLIKNHCEGITYNKNTMLLMQKPSRASVFEEFIHTAQYRDGKIDGTYKSRILCEIEAQKKLIQNAKVYKLTKREIEQTKRALTAYEKDLENLLKK